jgi:Uma2 family endonuclease
MEDTQRMSTEMVVPEGKPAYEWILGRPVQKVSPKRRHALLQAALLRLLSTWAHGRGEVGPEWRFRLEPPGEDIRPLVPDVAYLSYARMGSRTDDELEAPLLAPDAAVEIRSPDDRQAHIDHKIAVYLAAGTDVVILVDPLARTIDTFDLDGTRRFREGDVFTHATLPGLIFPVAQAFAVLGRPPAST